MHACMHAQRTECMMMLLLLNELWTGAAVCIYVREYSYTRMLLCTKQVLIYTYIGKYTRTRYPLVSCTRYDIFRINTKKSTLYERKL